ncbi:MAG: HPF/RaiA family ribosome-associated protein [Sulfurimicrobium sp.]|nr:HPF/RaiA family ribosome-associated protein [Sulfurimicrobium sp.]MDZ7657514.1 HPF/RaiA family ribosome-associated protein [Sulfurimicrobium sp.]
MQRQLQILFRNMPQSDAVETHIREKVEKLESFYSNIIGTKASVEIAGKHKHQGNLFNVRLDITVPGSELVVNRDMHEDVYVALRDAFDAAKRQLEDYARRQRGDTKTHEGELHGHVARLFEDGFGFIETADGQEYYFNRENMVTPSFEKLEVGNAVQFIEEAAAEGLQAKRISVGKHQFPG